MASCLTFDPAAAEQAERGILRRMMKPKCERNSYVMGPIILIFLWASGGPGADKTLRLNGSGRILLSTDQPADQLTRKLGDSVNRQMVVARNVNCDFVSYGLWSARLLAPSLVSFGVRRFRA